ncbi:MAG: hypothetical protein PVH84_02375 [Candidatus Aminicenantes bacterium]
MKSGIAFVSRSLFIFLILGMHVFNAQDGHGRGAPINPKFLRYMERLQRGHLPTHKRRLQPRPRPFACGPCEDGKYGFS